jgi:hypothetical protein
MISYFLTILRLI